MDLNEYLLVNDIHLADRAPSSCTDSYLDDLFDLLTEIGKLARARRSRAVVFAGDVFHIKTPSRTSHRTVMRLIDELNRWPCPVFITPGNHDMCVSEDTEALTDKGWLRLSQLDGTEQFATLNPTTHAFEWQRPAKIFVSRYAGEMIHFSGRRVDHLVTPNHDVYVRSLRGARRREIWRKRKAADAPNYNYWIAAMAAEAWEGQADATVRVPASASGWSPGFEISATLAAEFFGWYLSEGSVEPWRVVLSQSRTVNPVNYARIADLVKSMGFKPQLSKSTVRIGSAALAEYLEREFGRTSYTKRIPGWVKEWPVELLRLLLGAYLSGDGSPNGSTAWTARTASQQLADDLQEIGAKLGIGVTIGPRKSFPVRGTDYVGTALNVSFARPDVTLYSPKKVQYEGLVWCPNVPNGIWMVRRNGRPIWTGNSHDRLDSLGETQPLGVVFASGAAHPLDGWCDYAGGHPLYGVPWQQTWDDDTVTAVFDGWRRARPAAPVLAVAHAPLYPPGLELPYEFYPATAWAAAMGNTGTVHYGHVHEAHGIYTVDGVVFSNPGALSRGSLHEHNLTRQVALAAWNADTGTVQHLVLPHKPAEAVFRLVEADAAKTAALDLDRFLTAVGSHSLRITTTESIIEHLRGRDDITDDVRATAIELVEAVA